MTDVFVLLLNLMLYVLATVGLVSNMLSLIA